MRRKLWSKAPVNEGALGQMSKKLSSLLYTYKFFLNQIKQISNRIIFWFFIVSMPKKMETEKWPKAADSPLSKNLFISYSENREDNARDLLLGRVAEYISEYRYDVELVHFFSKKRIERKYPQAKYQLILYLKVNASGKYAEKRRYPVNGNEGKTILVDT